MKSFLGLLCFCMLIALTVEARNCYRPLVLTLKQEDKRYDFNGIVCDDESGQRQLYIIDDFGQFSFRVDFDDKGLILKQENQELALSQKKAKYLIKMPLTGFDLQNILIGHVPVDFECQEPIVNGVISCDRKKIKWYQDLSQERVTIEYKKNRMIIQWI